MELDIVQCYLSDAYQAYRACAASLGMHDPLRDLSSLLRAARTRAIPEVGKATASGGAIYEYRVHGAGYSFKELKSGKLIHFDVVLVDDVSHIRFSNWKLQQYAASIGGPLSEAAVASALRRVSATDPSMVHVLDGPYDYDYCRSHQP
jgi:hypothetical protein